MGPAAVFYFKVSFFKFGSYCHVLNESKIWQEQGKGMQGEEVGGEAKGLPESSDFYFLVQQWEGDKCKTDLQ